MGRCQCVVCGIPAASRFQMWRHPWKQSQTVCSACYSIVTICPCCENYSISQSYLETHSTEAETRSTVECSPLVQAQCRACRSVATVVTNADGRLHALARFSATLLSEHTGLPISDLLRGDLVTLRLGSGSQLDATYKNLSQADNVVVGATFGATYFYADKAAEIILCAGLSPILTSAFIAHELMHVWLHFVRTTSFLRRAGDDSPLPSSLLSNTSSLSSPSACQSVGPHGDIFEEGLCHLAAWVVLSAWVNLPPRAAAGHLIPPDAVQKEQARFWIEKFFRSSQAEFAQGFVALSKIARLEGWNAAVNFVVKR